MKNLDKNQKKKLQATFRIRKDIFKKVIKSNFQTSANCGISNILSGIKFEFANGILKIISTDGNRLLVNEIITEESEGACEAIYNGVMLGKIQFLKNYLLNSRDYIDYLDFTMTPDNLKIEDTANQIVYNVKSISGQYPKYAQLFPNYKKAKKNKYTQVCFNIEYLKELKNMSVDSRTKLIKIIFENNSPLSVVYAETENKDEAVTSKTLIMPYQIRD